MHYAEYERSMPSGEGKNFQYDRELQETVYRPRACYRFRALRLLINALCRIAGIGCTITEMRDDCLYLAREKGVDGCSSKRLNSWCGAKPESCPRLPQDGCSGKRLKSGCAA